ncbi:NADase-type glycan-binding domain-containing protein [Actinosynnema sp. CS-041913]|uniref:zinc ribbon domain-containing protein n=1 Tax=Actinosynnema sp. CS-041913 TaxID=3239917 RepID=UPI003D8B4F85
MGDSDDFCGNCGNYLGWVAGRGRSVAGGRAEERPAGRAEERPGGRTEGPSEGRTDVPPGVLAEEPPGEMAGDRSDSAGATGTGGVAHGRPGGGTGGAPGRAGVYLGPVPPGRPEAKRPLPSVAADEAVDGPPCPNCGTANPPGRRFCRRCATPLYPDEPTSAAGRRRRWRWRGDLSRWLRRLAALLVVVALVIAIWLFHPHALTLWEDLRDRLATPAPMAPTGITANAEVPDHPPAAAADGLSNRYWGAPAVGDSVEFTFATPFRLLSLVVHTGASAEEEGFVAQARPSALDVVVTTADGGKRTLPVSLTDKPGPQRTDTGISDVVRVSLKVRAATGLTPGRHIALGEVEFFRRP